MGLVWPLPILTGMLLNEAIPPKFPGGEPRVAVEAPGLDDELGRFRFIGPPKPPFACLGVCEDPKPQLLFKLEDKLELPDAAGLRPPELSLDFPDRLAPGDVAEEVEFVLCFALAAFPVY